METDTHLEELSALDAFFLYAEREEAPLHIGAVYLFEGGSQVAGGRGAQGIAETLEARLHLVPRYRQRVRFRPLNLGHPVWVDDPDFDLGYHVRRAALPRPGDEAALRQYAARVLARRLDVRKPLWELYVVEGLADGRVAVIHKVHHAMVDGISSVDIGTLLFDLQPEPWTPPPVEPWRPRPAPGAWELARGTVDDLRARVPASPLALGARLPGLVRAAAAEAMASPWAGAASLAFSMVRPGRRLSFNHLVGPNRRIHHLTIPLRAVKRVKDAFGGTVNDVLLAIVAEGVRGWMLEREEPVPEALRVFCPVSVRDEQQRYELGNLVSGMIVELPLGPMPPATRLARISTATGDLKRTRQAVAARSLTTLAGWAPATLHALGSRLASQPRFGLQSAVHLVVTNVPGPQVPFYTGGARMVEVWPLIPVYHTLGLSMALVSYDGTVHVGLTADRELVPDLDRVVRHLERAAAAVQALPRGRPSGRGARSRASRAKTSGLAPKPT
jgi:diacylglycerol O-acyltransferase / wax synthase